jgi:Tfp pilus assembly protein PilO
MREKVITFMAFSESGWSRRLRVSRQAVLVLGALLVGLTLMSALLAAYVVWAAPHLSRLAAVERENRSLTVQLSQQVARLNRLQGEMSRLRELEKSLRVISGLPDREGRNNEGAGGGETIALSARP